MEKKDKISIGLSVLALIISIGVFVDGKITMTNEANEQEIKNSYSAYKLGDKFGIYTVAYLHTNVGTPKEIQNFREDMLKSIQDPQSYADQLGLRIQLSDLLTNYDKNSAFNSRIYSIIPDRISSLYTERTTSAYECAFWASWCLMNAKISKEKQNEEFLIENFNSTVLPKIEGVIKILKLPKSSISEVNSAKELEVMSDNLRKKLNEEMSK